VTVGVTVSTSTIPGPGTVDIAPGSGYFVVGQAHRGNPTKAVLVNSMTQYQQLFGDSVSYSFLWNDLSMFFGEGGTHAWVARVVGPSSVAGSITLNDNGASGGVPTLMLTAGAPNIDPVSGTNQGVVADPGMWSTDLSVQPIASPLTGYFSIVIFYQGNQAEKWGPFNTVASAVAAINASSAYVLATNLVSTNTGVTANPLVLGSPTPLSAGTDDRTDVTYTMAAAKLPLFPPALGSGYVAIPGYDASLVGAALVAHATANGRLAHLSPVQGLSSTAVQSAAAAFRGTTGSQAAGYFWPWVTMPGVAAPVPPDGFVSGRRSQTVATAGQWQAPAGNWGVAQFVTGLDPASGVVTDTIGDQLNDECVSVIRPKAGTRLYGWRSLSNDTLNFALLNQQDTLNFLAFALQEAMQDYVFAIIDSKGQLFAQMSNSALAVLQPLIEAGALYAASDGSDPGYLVDTGTDVNTITTLQANEACIVVYVRLSPSAELIPVNVVKVPVGTAF
jgi:hypothetical protein